MSRDVKDWGDYEDDEELSAPVEVRDEHKMVTIGGLD